jgi:hypothetical protein
MIYVGLIEVGAKFIQLVLRKSECCGIRVCSENHFWLFKTQVSKYIE